MDPFSELAAVSRARGCGPIPTDSPLSGTGPSKPLGEDEIAYPSGAGVPACARGAAAADVGERVFSRVRDANMNEESHTYVVVSQHHGTRAGIPRGRGETPSANDSQQCMSKTQPPKTASLRGAGMVCCPLWRCWDVDFILPVCGFVRTLIDCDCICQNMSKVEREREVHFHPTARHPWGTPPSVLFRPRLASSVYLYLTPQLSNRVEETSSSSTGSCTRRIHRHTFKPHTAHGERSIHVGKGRHVLLASKRGPPLGCAGAPPPLL